MAKAKSTKPGQPQKKQPLPSSESSMPVKEVEEVKEETVLLELTVQQRGLLLAMFQNDLTEDTSNLSWSNLGPYNKTMMMENLRFYFDRLPIPAIAHTEKVGNETRVTYEIRWTAKHPYFDVKLKRMVNKSELDRIR